jgi:hypothetical protein
MPEPTKVSEWSGSVSAPCANRTPHDAPSWMEQAKFADDMRRCLHHRWKQVSVLCGVQEKRAFQRSRVSGRSGWVIPRKPFILLTVSVKGHRDRHWATSILRQSG